MFSVIWLLAAWPALDDGVARAAIGSISLHLSL
jgi:hypothetical protein